MLGAIEHVKEPAEPTTELLKEMRNQVKKILDGDYRKLKKSLPISSEDDDELNKLPKSEIKFIRQKVKLQLGMAQKF